MTRVFFCTDLHGSEICFRKFLHAGQVYEADVVIMGGDCTGKMIIPIVGNGAGGWQCDWMGRVRTLNAEADLEEQETQITNNGLYPVRIDQDELAALEAEPDRLTALFREVMLERVANWVALADERLRDSGLQVIFTPGNDDDFAVDEVLDGGSFVEAPEGRVTELAGGHQMLSLGWSTPTPWDTPRECTEEELADKIRELAEEIGDMENAVFNIHVPPYGTGLDSAPELESAERLKRGGTIMQPVGSTAVRDAILEYQPLLSLHGHIHESRSMQRLGRTVSINPGSAYSDWTLQGVLVDLEDGKVNRYVPVTG
jgi:Icc-related predicted phosphoesterase